MRHDIKILPEYFDKVIDGSKTFEIRENDRDYQVGDILFIHEYMMSHEHGNYETGGWILAEITYITNYNQKDNYIVMGIKVNSHQTGMFYRE